MAQSRSSCTTTREGATSKWSDVIKNSVETATEPIRIYQLNTVQEDLNNEGTVRIYTFGKKDSKKRNRTILIVGETGSGKSSIINMMVNYMLGVKWEDKIRFQIIPDDGTRRQTESQTNAITAYKIFGLEELSVPFSLTVIDTPGYGDTGRLEKDQSISQNLCKLLNFTKGIQQLDVVCLVVKATENRLSFSQKYIFDAILSIFGKNMEKNILTLITFSDWMLPSGALEAVTESGVPFPKDENDKPLHFLFNNLSLRKYEKKFENAYKTSWNYGIESMREFFQTLDRMETQSLRMTENVLEERKRLEACIQSFESQIKVVEMKLKALEEVKKTLEEHKEDIRKNNFQYKYTTVVMKKVTVQETALCCTNCQVNCHYPCTWVSDLSWCHVMKKEKCTACPGKCSYTVHKKGYKIYAPEYEEKTGTCEDLKKTSEGMIATQEEVMSTCGQEFRNAKAEKTSLIERCFQSILQLRDFALKFDSDSTRQSILRLIEVLKRDNEAEKAEMLQKILENTA